MKSKENWIRGARSTSRLSGEFQLIAGMYSAIEGGPVGMGKARTQNFSAGTRQRNHMKKKDRGVFILECLAKEDPGSEGQFLAHMFRLIEVPYQ